jgi:hypothetical protein
MKWRDKYRFFWHTVRLLTGGKRMSNALLLCHYTYCQPCHPNGSSTPVGPNRAYTRQSAEQLYRRAQCRCIAAKVAGCCLCPLTVSGCACAIAYDQCVHPKDPCIGGASQRSYCLETRDEPQTPCAMVCAAADPCFCNCEETPRDWLLPDEREEFTKGQRQGPAVQFMFL